MKFKKGDLVLVMRTQPGKPLSLKYFGSHKILKQTSPVDYLVEFAGTRKPQRVLHVNLLKPYINRTEFVTAISAEVKPPLIDTEVDEITSLLTEPEPVEYERILHLLPEQQDQLRALISHHSNIINDTPGRVKDFSHTIRLKPDAKPVVQRAYRMSPQNCAKLRKELDQMLVEGLIEPSCCEWASPVLVVWKVNSDAIRVVVYYKKVNRMVEGDCNTMHRIEDLIDCIGKAKYLTKLDLSKGFHQITLAEESKPITSFSTPFGMTYQYRVLPFGLKNFPACFCTMINNKLGNLSDICGVYLDDTVIYSNTWEEHLTHIATVLNRLHESNLTVKLIECYFVCPQVEYLGHIVGLGQMKPAELKVKALLEVQPPQNRRQLKSFLGCAGYYARYLPKYSDLTTPLTELLRKGSGFKWNSVAQASFDKIKVYLTPPPTLIIADFSEPFSIYIDASNQAVGSVLTQKDENNVNRPVCYYSKKLSMSQRNYSTTD